MLKIYYICFAKYIFQADEIPLIRCSKILNVEIGFKIALPCSTDSCKTTYQACTSCLVCRSPARRGPVSRYSPGIRQTVFFLYYSAAAFAECISQKIPFAERVIRDGRILYDRDGKGKAVLGLIDPVISAWRAVQAYEYILQTDDVVLDRTLLAAKGLVMPSLVLIWIQIPCQVFTTIYVLHYRIYRKGCTNLALIWIGRPAFCMLPF